MKVLIVGDSHVAQLRLAYNRLGANCGLTLEFVSGPGPVRTKLRFEGSRLHLDPDDHIWADSVRPGLAAEQFSSWYTNTEERFLQISGSNPIDLDPFDAVVVYGGRLISPTWWLERHDESRYSIALWMDYLGEKTKSSIHRGWLDQLHSHIMAGGKVFSLSTPLHSEAVFDPDIEVPSHLDGIRNMPQDADFSMIEPLYRRLVESLGATYIPQPKDLLSADRRATRRECRTPTPGDFRHLGNLGGDLMMASVLQALMG